LRNYKLSKKLKTIIESPCFIPLLLILLSCWIFLIKKVSTSPDSSWYLSNALNIYKGYGYVSSDWGSILTRGPVFATLIAISFWLFGVSLVHAFWVVKIFYVANVLLIYFIGKKLYGKWVGLISSLLILTSFAVNKWSLCLLLDCILPFFLLLAIYLLYIGFDKRNHRYLLLSGLVFAIAYLTKEMTIIFIPLPILACLCIKDFRNKKNIIGIFVLIVVLFGLLSPWLINMYQAKGSLLKTLGAGGPKVAKVLTFSQNDATNQKTSLKAIKYIKWFGNYYYQYFGKQFILAPLFVIAWVFTFIRGIIRREKQDLIMLLAAFLFVPIMLYLGGRGLREGQNIFIYLLSYIAIANFLFIVSNYCFKKLSSLFGKRANGQVILRYGLTGLVSIVLVIQVYDGMEKAGVWLKKKGKSGNIVDYYDVKKFQVGGWHNPIVKEAGEWIGNNVPMGSKLMSDWYWRQSLYFYAGGDYQIFKIPSLVFGKDFSPRRQYDRLSSKIEKPLFLWPNKNETDSDNHLRIIRQDELLFRINRKRADFIIVTYARNFLALYFEANPGFKKIADFGQGQIKIFQVLEAKPLNKFETRFGTVTSNYLKTLKEERPEKLTNLTENLFKERLGFSQEEIAKIYNDQYPLVEIYTIY